MRWLLLLIISATAVWAQPLVVIETVWVGDPGNAPDKRAGSGSFGFGSVNYEYRIGKFEITIGQYTAFLNSVASVSSDSYIFDLWNVGMNDVRAIAGISRSGSGTGGDPYNYSVIGSANRPMAYVSWFDAARFCNWLHNGATNGADTETGAYTLNGATTGIITKNAEATWWIPSENEWYKAAYYKGGGTNAGYWRYPTRSDNTPGNIISGATNQANYNNGVYSVTQSASFDAYGSTNYLTDVGAFGNSFSAYGTYDQGGNMFEWNDAVISSSRGFRGGSWPNNASFMQSSSRHSYVPTVEFEDQGFRVATAGAAPAPVLAVEQNPGSLLSNDAAASLLPCLADSQSDARVYTLRNSGSAALNNIVVIKSGSNSTNFALVAPATNSLQPAATTTLSVRFAPKGASGLRTAQISITSNDTNNSPFIINLSGFGLGEDLDTDGDGLNDAAEFTMSALGFDWQSNQPTLVAALYSNANRAQLFTQSQYETNRTAGQQDVIASPMAYGLYDSNSIMDLRMNGLMVQKQGSNAVVTFQTQTTTDLTQPFTNNGTPITNQVPMPGNKGFLRIQAK